MFEVVFFWVDILSWYIFRLGFWKYCNYFQIMNIGNQILQNIVVAQLRSKYKYELQTTEIKAKPLKYDTNLTKISKTFIGSWCMDTFLENVAIIFKILTYLLNMVHNIVHDNCSTKFLLNFNLVTFGYPLSLHNVCI